jgi:peptidoglycan hydrolase-like protein with peptidoglycan-binding domain
MKLKVIVPVLCLGLSVAAFGDELVKNAQSELKSQGFYYGEVTGINSPETVAAVKRYQIRNGLEVTGTLSNETLMPWGLGRIRQQPRRKKRPRRLKCRSASRRRWSASLPQLKSRRL